MTDNITTLDTKITLTEREKIDIMETYFKEYYRLIQNKEPAPYANFMAERHRLIKYNELIGKKLAKSLKDVC